MVLSLLVLVKVVHNRVCRVQSTVSQSSDACRIIFNRQCFREALRLQLGSCLQQNIHGKATLFPHCTTGVGTLNRMIVMEAKCGDNTLRRILSNKCAIICSIADLSNLEVDCGDTFSGAFASHLVLVMKGGTARPCLTPSCETHQL